MDFVRIHLNSLPSTQDSVSTTQESSQITRFTDGNGEYWDKKHLFIFFSDRKRLSYCSIPVNSILCCTQFMISGEFRYPGVYRGASNMSCFHLKDSVYLIGGDYERRCTIVRDGTRFSRRVLCFDILQPSLLYGNPDSPGRDQMHSGKGFSPIILEHQDILYVLASDCLLEKPKHHFESYNPKMDEWEILEPPPFYDNQSRHCVYRGERRPWPHGYVVLDNKICISNYFAAYAYDTLSKTWGPCYLFDGFNNLDRSSSDDHGDDYVDDINAFNDRNWGQNFDFFGKAMLYRNKFLISMDGGMDAVYAYKICSGRVVQKQTLVQCPDNTTLKNLVALDEDLFCLSYTEDGKHILVLVTFWVSISKEGSQEYLACGVLNTCKTGIISECRIELFAVSGSNPEKNVEGSVMDPTPGGADSSGVEWGGGNLGEKLPTTQQEICRGLDEFVAGKERDEKNVPQNDSRSAARPYIPDNVVTAILCRLPVNSILNFRRVCQKWVDLISKQVHVKNFSSPMILVQEKSKIDELLVLDKWEAPGERPEILKIFLDSHVVQRSFFSLSYDGLIVSSSLSPAFPEKRDFLIFNPVFRDKVKISILSSTDDYHVFRDPWYIGGGFDIYGMFFNTSIKEYCLLWGSFETGPNVQFKVLNLGVQPCFRDLKQPKSLLHRPRYPVYHPPVVINNTTLYWLVISSYCHKEHKFNNHPSCDELIMAFDTESEEFSFMPHPGPTNGCHNSWHWNMHILKMDGSLSFLRSTTTEKSFIVDIWKLQDSVTRLWIRRGHSVVIDIDIPDVISGLRGIFGVMATENGEVLLAVGNGRGLVYSYQGIYLLNLELRNMKRILGNYRNFIVSTYVPTFVSLSKCEPEFSI